MSALWSDTRYGFRMLMKKPGFTVIAVLTLAVGIGSNIAIFSFVNTYLLRPFPYDDAERLVDFTGTHATFGRMSIAYSNFLDWQRENQTFEELACYRGGSYNLTGTDTPERIRYMQVSSNFLPMLGASPVLGRLFKKADDRAEAEPTVIISQGFWQRRFEGKSEAIGQSIILDGDAYTIIGVLPSSFNFPPIVGNPTDIWTPIGLLTKHGWFMNRGSHNGTAGIGKLKEGVILAGARADLNRIAGQLEKTYPDSNAGCSVVISGFHERITGDIRPTLLVLMCAVVFVLLIVCVNIANLLLVRSTDRIQEFSIRSALGAGRLRIIRQLLCENLILVILGGALGIVVAKWGYNILCAQLPDSVRQNTETLFRIDVSLTVFTLAITLGSGLVFGLFPAWRSSKVNISTTMRDSGRTTSGGLGHSRMRDILVISEIALALVLLVGAGLMLRSFIHYIQADPGYNPDSTLTARVYLPDSRYPVNEQKYTFYKQLIEQVKSMPSVKHAGVTRNMLGGWQSSYYVEGAPIPESGQNPYAEYNVVSPDLFKAMGIRLLSGRVFTKHDSKDGQETTVVGVMPATFEFSSPWYSGHDYNLWVPLSFDLESQGRGNHWLLGVARLKQGVTVEAADAEIKAIGTRLSKTYPNSNSNKPFLVLSLRDQMTRRSAYVMRILFSAVVLLLLVACANVASMLLARGTQRQDEFSVRLALGASRMDVVRLLFVETVLLGLLGSATGIVFAFWGTAALRNLIPPRLIIEARRAAIQINGRVLLFAVGLAFLSALLAGLLPAFTAARTSIVETLKSGGRSHTGSRIRHRFLRQLVVGQITVAVVLANCGILLFASYLNVYKSNDILNTEQVISAEISLHGDKYNENEAMLGFWDQFFERIEALPGVQKVAITTKMPLEGGNNSDVLVDDEVYVPGAQKPMVEYCFISPDYLGAMGLTLLKGRTTEPKDASSEYMGVVINRAMAEKYWKGKDAIGRLIRPNDPEPPFTMQVIGVVEDVRQWGSEHSPLPEVYAPYAFMPQTEVFLFVRASGEAGVLVPAIRRELAALDADLPLANVRTIKDVLNASTSERRMSTGLINVFMSTALVLAMVGIYGTLSYNLLQRRQEIGVRIAMGALRHHIIRFVFRQAGLWVIAGLLIGLTLTAAISFLLRSMVFNISPWNPLTLLLGLGVVGGAACIACILPALRATRVDPMKALRYE